MSENEMNETIARIAAASRILNDAAAEASERTKQLDDQLAEAEPGVATWGEVLLTERATFAVHGGIAEQAQRTITLGYAKTKKKKWCLCVREQIKGKKGALLDEEITSLRKADRTLRLMAMPHLSALALAIVEQLETATEQLASWQPAPEPEPEEPPTASALELPVVAESLEVQPSI